jgi:UDPglucose 6-dehydrogenase
VGTPSAHDGSADLSALWKVVDAMAPFLRDDAVVVTKSTVPVGTNQKIYDRFKQLLDREVDVASNPEFLKEGAAIQDFMYPDRVVVGVRRKEVADVLEDLYRPFLRTEKPFLVMSPQSAEMTKYVANAILSTKISFINEMANICERMHGDINDVRRGIGHDQRIGFAFLHPGVGYGGSCFPKDVRALASMARELGIEPSIMEAVDAVNEKQKFIMPNKVAEHFEENLKGRTIAVWGLAFKPRTDDIREAPALTLIKYLLNHEATVRVHDPEAIENVKKIFGEKISYSTDVIETLRGADALVINTEWAEYRNLDLGEIKDAMNSAVIFDGRNLYETSDMQEAGVTYYSIGRTNVCSLKSQASKTFGT